VTDATPPRVIVHANEVTCLVCGETFPASWHGCPRCTDDQPDRTGYGSRYRATPTVPTLSYLREGEYDRL
jgi:hypothetical protein